MLVTELVKWLPAEFVGELSAAEAVTDAEGVEAMLLAELLLALTLEAVLELEELAVELLDAEEELELDELLLDELCEDCVCVGTDALLAGVAVTGSGLIVGMTPTVEVGMGTTCVTRFVRVPIKGRVFTMVSTLSVKPEGTAAPASSTPPGMSPSSSPRGSLKTPAGSSLPEGDNRAMCCRCRRARTAGSECPEDMVLCERRV